MRLSGARQAIHDATAMDFSTREGVGRSRYTSTGVIASRMQAGQVLAELKKLPEPCQDWALWAYACAMWPMFAHEQIVYAWLLGECSEFLYDIHPKKRRAKSFQLVKIAMIDYRHRQQNGRALFHNQDMANAIRVNHTQWERDRWNSLIGDIASVMDAWDRRALTAVAGLINRMAAEEESSAA